MKYLILSVMFLIGLTDNAQNRMTITLKNGSDVSYYVSEIEKMTWSEDDIPGGDNDPTEQTVTGDASDITNTTATLTCYANNILDNLSSDLKVGIIYTTDGTPNKKNGIQNTISTSSIGSDGKYTLNLTGLTATTIYYYRSFVYQNGLWFYGKIKSFTTTGSVTFTANASNITCFSAKVSAIMSTSQSVDYKDLTYGICYGMEPNPTFMQPAANVDTNGQYCTFLRKLKCSTVYYYRPYTIMNDTIFYGQTSSFRTIEDNVVNTGDADENGNVKSKLTISGGAYSTLELGLCWSATNEDPTVGNIHLTTNEVDDENCYNINIYDYGTFYYRAYVLIDSVAHYGAIKCVEHIFDPSRDIKECVDLGLSVKWATCNVGASSPEEYGDYFAWGEIIPKSTYDYSTYKYCRGGSSENYTKYNSISEYGLVDNKTVLESEDDVATANWGSDWRMPTDTECTELRTKCTWTWTTKNDVNGYKVTGINGNSIFLPAAGTREYDFFSYVGSQGLYWSSSHATWTYRGACYMYFSSNYVSRFDNGSRCFGLNVRPVCP